MCAVQHMSSCISTKLFAKSGEVVGWRVGWVGVGEGWSGDGGAVVMIQDGAKLILAWGCLSRGWHVEVRFLALFWSVFWSGAGPLSDPFFGQVFGRFWRHFLGHQNPNFFRL